MSAEDFKYTDLIMWNGIDMELYIQSHNPACINTVKAFLRTFRWDRNALRALEYLVEKYGLDRRVKAKSRSQTPGRPQYLEHEVVPGRVTSICPDCGGPVYGTPLSNCHIRDTNRVYYEECRSCSYWSEIFRAGDTEPYTFIRHTKGE